MNLNEITSKSPEGKGKRSKGGRPKGSGVLARSKPIREEAENLVKRYTTPLEMLLVLMIESKQRSDEFWSLAKAGLKLELQRTGSDGELDLTQKAKLQGLIDLAKSETNQVRSLALDAASYLHPKMPVAILTAPAADEGSLQKEDLSILQRFTNGLDYSRKIVDTCTSGSPADDAASPAGDGTTAAAPDNAEQDS